MGSTEELGTTPENMLRSCVGIADDFVVPEAKYGPAFALQELGAPQIIGGRFGVLTTIKLHGQLCFATCKIDDVRVEHQLAREAWAKLGKAAPKQAFGPCRSVAELAGSGR